MKKMSFSEFCKVYITLLNLRNLDIKLSTYLQVDVDSKNSEELEYLLKDSSNLKTWNDVVNYQLCELKQYLKNYWEEMLEYSDSDDSRAFLQFLFYRQELIMGMDKNFIKFLLKLNQAFPEINDELLWNSEAVKKLLQSYSKDKEVCESFFRIIRNKFQHLQTQNTCLWDKKFFFEWLPEWKYLYPKLRSILICEYEQVQANKKFVFETREYKRFYELYF